MTTTAALFGCTGLVGAKMLTALLASDSYATVHTISRRVPKESSAKLQATVEADNEQWVPKLKALSPFPTAVFSGLGTSRAAAGGVKEQWKIDHDLNVAIAEAAKEAGAGTFVFISSAGTRGMLSSSAPYSKMKIGVEDTIKDLGFDHAIILRPGLILGDREVEHTGGPLMNGIVRGLGMVSKGLTDALGQESEVIARAAVHAAQIAAKGEAPSKYWVLEQKDIIRLGRDEWKS